jgi:NAD dependent epimerase/dehydratase family enzyme
MKVLVTGSSGFIGTELVPYLKERQPEIEIVPFDITVGHECQDVTRMAAVTEHIEDCDAVIHLAIVSGSDATQEGDALNHSRYDVHVGGTATVCTAAARQRAAVIYASSLSVMWGYAGSIGRVNVEDPPKPVGTYALTKALGEQIVTYHVEKKQLQAVILRLARPVTADEADSGLKVLPQWLGMVDCLRAIELSLKHVLKRRLSLSYLTKLHIVGPRALERWNGGAALEQIGFAPTIDLCDHGFEIRPEPTSYIRRFEK